MKIYDKELLAIVDSFQALETLFARWSPSSHGTLRPQKSRVLYVHEEAHSSTGSMVFGTFRIIRLQSLISDMDLHVIRGTARSYKKSLSWNPMALIIADFLAGEDNVWMDDIPEVTLEKCKKELKNFLWVDNWSDNSSFLVAVHEKDIKDFISRCPQCQLNQSASGIHSPLPIRPVPPVALPFERWGIDFYGPMAETKSGNRYLITCIDYATRWVLAKPVKEMTESAVAAFLMT
ncbi:hypothetical protein BASA83_007175 [Batrachochytrium salamandrivorans]|nr:hypothetical protein BASA83_007175 [Batrachochytrium salamandrivorans]